MGPFKRQTNKQINKDIIVMLKKKGFVSLGGFCIACVFK